MRKLFLVSLVVVAVLTGTISFAQDPEATPADVIVVTPDGGPIVVTPSEDGEVIVTPGENTVVVNVWTLLVVIVGAFVTGGVTFPRLARFILGKPDAVRALENIVGTLKPATRKALYELLAGVDDVVELGKVVFDDIPADQKPQG